MENGIEPKRTISLNWDDPWKKYEVRWKKHPQVRWKILLNLSISLLDMFQKKSKFQKMITL